MNFYIGAIYARYLVRLDNTVVSKMKSTNQPQHVDLSRLAFIEILSAEFTSRTGVGVYVFLTPVAINTLFGHYLNNTEQTISIFVKEYVRHYSIEHHI